MASKRWVLASALLLLLVALSGFLGGAEAARTIKHDHSDHHHHQRNHLCDSCVIYEVGDKDGWTNDGVYYGLWSWTKDFYEGDVVVFNYDKKIHKILEVTLKDYLDCNIENPIKMYDSGHDSFTISSENSHRYFISGDRQNCLTGQKVNIRVAQEEKEEEETTYHEQSFYRSSTRHKSPTNSPPIPPPSTPSPSVVPPSATANSASPKASSLNFGSSGRRALILVAAAAATIALDFLTS